MIEFYPQIRLVHISAAVASGSLFVVRGLLVSAGRDAWALAMLPRYVSYAIDTTLLTAALMLLTILPSSVFANGWLVAKLALLPAYVTLGWLALRRPRPVRRQLSYFGAALLAYLGMFLIARSHDPLGPFRLLGAA